MPNKIAISALIISLSSFSSISAFAEDLNNTNQAPEVRDIPNSTVYVTSRRRVEELQSTPLAVSSISGKQIESSGNFNVSRITQIQPALQFYSQNQRNTTVNIRGLGAPFGLTNDGIEQGVGFYIDDVYYARAASAALDFVDVAQVEVLRGPQGTLYGKNTTAGALNISTRAPSFDNEGRATLSFGNFGYTQFRGSISGPLSENVAARLSTSYTKRNGTSYNVARQEDINQLSNFSARGQLLWNISDDLKLTFYGDYSEQRPNGAGQVYVRVAPTLRAANRQFAGLLSGINLAAGTNYSLPSLNPFDRLVDHDSKTRGLQHNSGASLRLNWNNENSDLTSVTAWRTWSWRPSNDRDWIGLPITTISANPSDQEQWQQEFRYHSEINEQFEYIAGLFYFNQKIHSTGLTSLGSAASYWLNGPANTATNSALDSVLGHHTYADYSSVLNGLRQDSNIHFKSKSAAIFGRLTWHLDEKLDIDTGLRYNYDSKNAFYDAVVTGGLNTSNSVLRAIQTGQLSNSNYIAEFEDYNLSGDLTGSYKINPQILFYGTYAKSFKSGGINLNGIPNGANGLPAVSEFATVKPESTNHYELGLKTQLNDRRATINLAAFQTDIKDYQAIVQLAASGSSTLRGVLASVPKVEVKGFEIESTYRPTDNWRIYFNSAYLDGIYKEFTNAPVALERSGGALSFEDISGKTLPGISKWTLSYGVEYRQNSQLFNNDGEVYIALDGATRSRFSSSPTPSDYTWIDGYSVLNFRTGIRTSNDWDLSFWVKNLDDTEYFTQLTQQSGATGLIVGDTGEPRTYGISLSLAY